MYVLLEIAQKSGIAEVSAANYIAVWFVIVLIVGYMCYTFRKSEISLKQSILPIKIFPFLSIGLEMFLSKQW